ncbi:MAG: hypothetical protein KatS3mg105_2168 [Gemmatales bacterium]|nr:MAG: hypothetical protein KatS3mg105_2168 [Gemmatales bacterium]
MENQVAQRETEFVWRRLTESINIGGVEYDGMWWLAILVPVLVIGLVYVIVMYMRDSQSVGWGWAAFLGFLRSSVYVILAIMFLLPAMQDWEKTETHSRVLVVFDVSRSMQNADGIPFDKRTRQDKVIEFLTDGQKGFLRRLQEKTPLVLYRFGGRLDTQFEFLAADSSFGREKWYAWLHPDPNMKQPADLNKEQLARFHRQQELHRVLLGSTDIGGAVLEVLNRESHHLLQGIIIVSDGRNTQYSSQSMNEVKSRAAKLKVPIFTVAVGEITRPINIYARNGLLVPDRAPPDEVFPVRVEIDGKGLAGASAEVTLNIIPPGSNEPALTMKENVTFAPGDPPHTQAEFHIDPEKMPPAMIEKDPKTGKPGLIQGAWRFQAKVSEDKRETSHEDNVTNVGVVNIVKKPLRVLLFASGPTREYQFLRTLLDREVRDGRAEMSIYLQLARRNIVQDVPPERLLTGFPNFIADPNKPDIKPDDKYYNLLQYDVIVCFDPDWTQLLPQQTELLEEWVSRHYGGLIFVAGPLHTKDLRDRSPSKPPPNLAPVVALAPVVFDDNRIRVNEDKTEPYRLQFPGASKETEFLKIDEENDDPMVGWEKFFTGASKIEEGRDLPLRRGFYDYYPVKSVKPGATVVATFGDPKARTRTDNQPQPFLVTMPYTGGKTIYIGSGEMWRLRQYSEAFHERFWTKLLRYAGAGSRSGSKRRGILVVGSEYSTHDIVRVEAKLLGGNMQPLDPTSKPVLELVLKDDEDKNNKPQTIPLDPKLAVPLKDFQAMDAAEKKKHWDGWFAGRFEANAPGVYKLRLKIPGANETLEETFRVKDTDPETTNVQPDFKLLHELASLAKNEVRPRISEEVQTKLHRALVRTNSRFNSEGEDDQRLYFDLETATIIPDCMVKMEPRVHRSRGPVRDLWDAGFEIGNEPPMKISYALFVIVGLLSIEWLTRKLLRLA